jgi:hypothetical protein
MTSGETHGIFLYAKEHGMTDFRNPLASIPNAFFVNAGEDRFGEYRRFGISSIAFKPCYAEKTKTAALTKIGEASGLWFIKPGNQFILSADGSLSQPIVEFNSVCYAPVGKLLRRMPGCSGTFISI